MCSLALEHLCHTLMGMAIRVIPKKRGRPATGKDPLVSFRFPADLLAALDERAQAQGLSRSQLVRQMLLDALSR